MTLYKEYRVGKYVRINEAEIIKRMRKRTMLDRAKRLSSSLHLFCKEWHDLRKMFLKLKYPAKLIDSTFRRFHVSQDQIHDQSRIKLLRAFFYFGTFSTSVIMRSLAVIKLKWLRWRKQNADWWKSLSQGWANLMAGHLQHKGDFHATLKWSVDK